MSDTCRRPRMKAVIAGLIVALMMAFALPGAALAEDATLTVYAQTGRQAASTIKAYTPSELEALAAANTDVSADKPANYIYKGKTVFNALHTDKLVTFDALFGNAFTAAGVQSSWATGARLVYSDSSGVFTKLAPTYEAIENPDQFYYPNTTDSVDTGNAEAVKAGLSLENKTAALNHDLSAGAVNWSSIEYSSQLRTVMGCANAEDTAGNRFYTNPTGITIVTPVDIAGCTITMNSKFVLDDATAGITPMPTSVTEPDGTTALTAGTDYTVTYYAASDTAKATALTSITAPGDYVASIAAKADASSPYYKGSKDVSITVTYALIIYTQTGRQTAVDVADYTTSDLAALADITENTDYIYKGKTVFNVLRTDKMVTFSTLLGKVGSWSAGARLVYSDASGAFTKLSPTYEQINAAQYYYPYTTSSVDTSDAVAVKAGLALDWAAGELDADTTAAAKAKTLVPAAGLRTVAGCTSATDIAGNRFYTSPTGITVVTPVDMADCTVDMPATFVLDDATAGITPMPTSVTEPGGTTALTAGADYTVTYYAASDTAKATALTSITATGDYVASIAAKADASSPYYKGSKDVSITVGYALTIYAQYGLESPTIAKQYTLSNLEALAAANTDVSADKPADYIYKGKTLNVLRTDKMVTFDALFKDAFSAAGMKSPWFEGARLVYSDASGAFTKLSPTYEQINAAQYYYPYTTNSVDTSDAVAVKAGLALDWAAGALDAETTAAAKAKTLVPAAGLRTVAGCTSATDIAGNRFYTSPTGITVVIPFNILYSTVTMDKNFLLGDTAITPMPTSVTEPSESGDPIALTAGTDYVVTYYAADDTAKANALTSITEPGVYTAVIAAKADATSPYFTGSTDVTINVGKSALAIYAQTGKQSATKVADYTTYDLADMADITTNTDYVYAGKGGFNVLRTNSAVTFNTLLGNVDSWQSGASLVYADASGVYNKYYPTYAQINAKQYYYPKTTNSIDDAGKLPVRAALALNYATGTLDADTAAAVKAATLTPKAGLRTVMGCSSTTDIYGYRLMTNPTSITVVTPESITGSSMAMDSMFNIAFGSDGIKPAPTSVTDAEGNALTQDDDYVIVYRDLDGNTVDEITDAGTYIVTVDADASDTTPYYSGLRYKIITVTRDSIIRIAGDTRYDTANAIAAAAYPNGCDTVIVAGGNAWADSLSVAGYAGANKAAVLLTDTASLPDSVSAQIAALKATKVVIVGGAAAVSKNVESQLDKIVGTSNVTRLSGDNRFATSVAIDNALASKGSYAIIASGVSAADALSASGYAYAEGTPIYLADNDGKLTDESVSAINKGAYTKILLVGGTARISDDVKSQVTTSGATFYRIAGTDRYDTSYKFAQWAIGKTLGAAFQPEAAMSVNGFCVACGEYVNDAPRPDALAGSALVGTGKSIMLLTASAGEDNSNILGVVSDAKSSIKTAYVLGGTSAVSDDAMKQFGSAITG